MRFVLLRILTVLCLLCASVSSAAAQNADDDYKSHWGISATLVPRWSFPTLLANLIDTETDMEGTEFRVGLVRGSDRGGDVGVSFVKKLVDDGSFVQQRQTACVQVPGSGEHCARGTYDITERARMTGVEAHLFIPFADFTRRVQLGGTFAIGVAKLEGTSDRFVEHLVVNGSSVTTVTDSLGVGPFRDSWHDWKELSPFPIGRAEIGVGVLIRPGLKVRASGGISFPGVHRVGVYAQYLFGVRSGPAIP